MPTPCTSYCAASAGVGSDARGSLHLDVPTPLCCSRGEGEKAATCFFVRVHIACIFTSESTRAPQWLLRARQGLLQGGYVHAENAARGTGSSSPVLLVPTG